MKLSSCQDENKNALECNFVSFSDGYNCDMLKIDQNNKALTGVEGAHIYGRTNSEVDVLYMSSFRRIEYLPLNICKFFNNLKKFDLHGGSILEIKKETFNGCDLITEIVISSSRLTSLEQNLLADMPKLEVFALKYTKIEYLHEDFFKNNLKLKKLELDENQLRVINSNFDPLTSLTTLSVLSNPCVNLAHLREGSELSLTDVIEAIKRLCNNNTNPNVLSTTPATETSDYLRLDRIENLLAPNPGKDIDEKIQKLISQKDLQIDELKESHQEYQKSFEPIFQDVKNINEKLENISNIHNNLFKSSEKVQTNFRNIDSNLNSIESLEKQIEEFRDNVDDSERIMWGLFAVQIMTLAFAFFITVHLFEIKFPKKVISNLV